MLLSLFPQVLFLAPLATTMLRVAAGIVFLLLAWTHWQKREEMAAEKIFLLGGVWVPTVAFIAESVIGACLVLGIYTQVIALLGALGALKCFVWKRRFGQFLPLSRTASALLFVICLSLVATGAGAFAFDLPL